MTHACFKTGFYFGIPNLDHVIIATTITINIQPFIVEVHAPDSGCMAIECMFALPCVGIPDLEGSVC